MQNPNGFLYKRPTNKIAAPSETQQQFEARFGRGNKTEVPTEAPEKKAWDSDINVPQPQASDTPTQTTATDVVAPVDTQATTPVDTTIVPTQITPVSTTTTPVSGDYLSTQSPSNIAQLVVDNKIKTADLQQLQQTDPVKYQEVTATIQKKQAEAQYNMTAEDYKKSMDSYITGLQNISTPSPDEMQGKYNEYVNTPQYTQLTSQLTNVVGDINTINDQLEYLVDDLIDANQGSSGLLISALTNKGRKELVRERNGLINEATLLQSQVEQHLSQAQQQFDIYQQSIQDKKNFDINMLATKYGIDGQKAQLDFQMLDKTISQADSVLSSIGSMKAAEAEFARDMAKEELNFAREMTRDDLKFERDMYQSQVEADRNFSYDKVLKSMDIESQFAIKDFDVQSQFAMLRLKHDLDQSGVDYNFQKMEDGTIMAINSKNPSDYKVLGSNGQLGGDYFSGIGTGKITSYGGQHDNYRGIDIDGKIGDPIPSMGGRVVKVVSGKGKSSTPSYGNYVDVMDANGNTHRYAHLSNVSVNVGDELPYGASVGQMGNSGYTIAGPNGDGSHLDYSVKKADGSWYNAKEIPGYIATIQPKDKLTAEQLTLVSALQSIQQDITDDTKGFNRAVGTRGLQEKVSGWIRGKGELGFSVGSQAGAFASKVEQVRNLLTIPALQYLKGPTSDKDIDFIRTAQSTLSTDLPETEFIKIVDELEQVMIRNFGNEIDLSEFGYGNTTPTSSYLID